MSKVHLQPRLLLAALAAAALLWPARVNGTDAAPAPDDSEKARVAIEHRVDAGALEISGTILLVTRAEAADDDGYLVRIDSCNQKSAHGRVIMIVQDQPGRTAGQPWPEAGKKATIYQVGTTPYITPQDKPEVVPCYVPDRTAAIVWAFSQ